LEKLYPPTPADARGGAPGNKTSKFSRTSSKSSGSGSSSVFCCFEWVLKKMSGCWFLVDGTAGAAQEQQQQQQHQRTTAPAAAAAAAAPAATQQQD